MENIAREKFSTAANLIMKHGKLLNTIQEAICTVLDDECTRLCKSKDFMLFHCTPKDLKCFSFAKMKSDLQRLAPFLFSLLSTVTRNSPFKTCAAASVLIRGRNDKLPSAFAYYVNSVLQYGGAKKAVYQRLCKLGITTNHDTAVRKQRAMANTCDDALQQLKAANESFINSRGDAARDGDVLRCMEMLDLSGKRDRSLPVLTYKLKLIELTFPSNILYIVSFPEFKM